MIAVDRLPSSASGLRIAFCAEIKIASGRSQSHALDFTSGSKIIRSEDGSLESRLHQPFLEILAITPDMVFLSECHQSFLRRGNRRVLASRTRIGRHHQERPATVAKHAVEFAKCLPIILDMLKDMVAIHRVETGIGMPDVADVHLLHGMGIEQVRTQVTRASERTQSVGHARFRGHMKQPGPGLTHELWMPVQEQPQQTMSLQRSTVNAKCIHSWGPASGDETPEGLSTDWAMAPIACVDNSPQMPARVRHQAPRGCKDGTGNVRMKCTHCFDSFVVGDNAPNRNMPIIASAQRLLNIQLSAR